MKKFIAAFLIILVLTLSGCGEASDVGVHLTDSQRYSETELNNVVEAAVLFIQSITTTSITNRFGMTTCGDSGVHLSRSCYRMSWNYPSHITIIRILIIQIV